MVNKTVVFLHSLWHNVLIKLTKKGDAMKNFKLPKGVQMDLEPEIEDVDGMDEPNGNASTPQLTRFMVGTYLDPVKGWMIAQAKFDPITQALGEFSVQPAAGDREVMRERFQIKVVSLGLFDAETPKEETAFNIY